MIYNHIGKMVRPLYQSMFMSSTIEPIKKSAISEEISAQLLSMIRQGKLSAGEKLPPERELAAMLNVSRPSLREALRALAIMNIIEMRQGDGTYISSLEPETLVEHLDFVLSLDDSTFMQLFEARKIVEVGITALAAERITDNQIRELEALQSKSLSSMDNHETFLAVDLELHNIITDAAGNPFLKRFLTSLSRISLASRQRTVSIPGVSQQSAEDHQAIIAALKARDSRASSNAMLAHLNHVEKSFLDQSRADYQEESIVSSA